MIRIMLADDHQVVRQGVKALLDAEQDLEVVGEAADGLEVADLAERLQPDVLVLDLMMPGLNGVEVARHVSRRCSHTAILVLSMHANEAYVLASLKNGARGYLLKDASSSELTKAVRVVASGKRYLGAPLSERAIDAYVDRVRGATYEPYDQLTDRERQVLQLAAEGLSNPEVAERLCISHRTVEVHRANVMRKLGLQNHTDLIRYALRRGIIPMER